jgi:thiosulfate sulfurtransferase
MFKHISTEDAAQLMAAQACTVVDIRDQLSFDQGHIPNAIALNQENLASFIENAVFEQPLLVCCYHGISSQGAANMLAEQGFNDVYSIDGGFEAWQQSQTVSHD